MCPKSPGHHDMAMSWINNNNVIDIVVKLWTVSTAMPESLVSA